MKYTVGNNILSGFTFLNNLLNFSIILMWLELSSSMINLGSSSIGLRLAGGRFSDDWSQFMLQLIITRYNLTDRCGDMLKFSEITSPQSLTWCSLLTLDRFPLNILVFCFAQMFNLWKSFDIHTFEDRIPEKSSPL